MEIFRSRGGRGLLANDFLRLLANLKSNQVDEIDPDEWIVLLNTLSPGIPELCNTIERVDLKTGELKKYIEIKNDDSMRRYEVLALWRKHKRTLCGAKRV